MPTCTLDRILHRALPALLLTATAAIGQTGTEVFHRTFTGFNTGTSQSFGSGYNQNAYWGSFAHAYGNVVRVPAFDTMNGTRQLTGVTMDVTFTGFIKARMWTSEPTMHWKTWLWTMTGTAGPYLRRNALMHLGGPHVFGINNEYTESAKLGQGIFHWLSPQEYTTAYAIETSLQANPFQIQYGLFQKTATVSEFDLDCEFLLYWQMGGWVEPPPGVPPGSWPYNPPWWSPAWSWMEASVALTYEYVGPASSWEDLGGGTIGTDGQPFLTATGSTVPGQPASWQLTHAAPGTIGLLLASPAQVSLPLFAGTLIPDPFVGFTVPLATDAAGAWTHSSTWPATLAVGQSMYFQCLALDPVGVEGISISNALRGITL